MAGATGHRLGSAAADRSAGDPSRGRDRSELSPAAGVRRLYMTPLPASLGGGALMAWRLDQAIFATTWDSGEGAYLVGGRWNSRGVRAVYCSIDPAIAILE